MGGLSWETGEKHLKEYFEKYGPVEKVELKLDPMTGRSRGFAFVVYESPESVAKVMDVGEGHAINSKKVDVKKAKGRTGKLFVGGLKVIRMMKVLGSKIPGLFFLAAKNQAYSLSVGQIV